MQRLGGFLITKIKQLHSRALAQCISEKGVEAFSGEQGKILFVLWQKNKITQKELANETGLAKNTITIMLERMEKNNLIKRIADENDKRKVLLIAVSSTCNPILLPIIAIYYYILCLIITF